MNIIHIIISFATLWMTHSIYCRVLDLWEIPLPADVNVFEGEFSNGGAYRVFHSKTHLYSVIKYGCSTFSYYSGLDTNCCDLFIEEYRRDGMVYFELFPMSKIPNTILMAPPRIFHLYDCGKTRVSRSVLNAFLDGPIYLKLDVGSRAKNHPLIVSNNFQHGQSYYTEYTVNHIGRQSTLVGVPSRWKVRYLISMIHNSDLPLTANGINTSSIWCVTNQVKRNNTTGIYTVDVQQPPVQVQYIVDPSRPYVMRNRDTTLDSISYWKPYVSTTDSVQPDEVLLIIDTINHRGPTPHLLSLANIPIGEWFYFRHQVVLSQPLRRLRVKVVDVKGDVIYESADEVFVTHVEAMVHNVEPRFEVVINEQLWSDNSLICRSVIYSNQSGHTTVTYEANDPQEFDGIVRSIEA